MRTFCYLRGLDAAEYFGDALYNVTDASGAAIWDRSTITQDAQYKEGNIFGVCACYALYGEGGEQPLPGGVAGSFCEECKMNQTTLTTPRRR